MTNDAVFQYWRAVEALIPQDVARLDPHDKSNPVYGVGLGMGGTMPWADAAHTGKKQHKDCEWRYVAQCGIYSTDALSERMVESIGGGEGEAWREHGGGLSRLFDLAFDAAGFPLAHTFTLALAAWSAGQILRDGGSVEFLRTGGRLDAENLPCPGEGIPSVNSGLAAFDELSRMLAQWVADEEATLRGRATPADVHWVQRLIHMVAGYCSIPRDVLDGKALCRVRATHVKKATAGAAANKSEAVDILSSFFVEDLHRVGKAWAAGNVGKGLVQFMAAGTGKHRVERVDVRDSANANAVNDALRPERMPLGRWPSDHALVFSQQLAVNEAWAGLVEGAGVFAVNGPPGTGKTTLLRDVVAAVVTHRAVALTRMRSGHLGEKRTFRLGDVWVPYYPLHASLQGHSIVVASSNNGAIENVTLELPGVSAVPARVAQRASYFAEIASSVTAKEAWALIAAPLGNKKNRTDFLNKFWWNRPSNEVEAETQVSGLREHLKAVMQGQHAPAVGWEDAVGNFKAAMAREKGLRSGLSHVAKLPEHVANLVTRLGSDDAALQGACRSLADRQQALGQFNVRIEGLKQALQRIGKKQSAAQERRAEHQRSKPGLLLWISTLGRAQRQWREAGLSLSKGEEILRKERVAHEAELSAQRRDRDVLVASVEELGKRRNALENDKQQTQANLREHEAQLKMASAELGSAWPNPEADMDERERIEPWAHKAWLQAREDLFIAALDVHRAFVEHHAVEMMANLNLASDWLSGKTMPPELARTALDSLCMVVPVISTTFASVPRMFANVTQEGIGWLLIDEAGQALPSHAAGAIWRAKRTIVVGDPRQLEPVCPLPAAVETKLASIYRVESAWWPSQSSAQSLADRSARMGTMLADANGQGEWVGCPLRLHRRCDEPMFSISNHVAYGGMMVQGKRVDGDAGLPVSRWIDVQADTSEGHWVQGEGVQAQQILEELLNVHGVAREQIAMISPFRDCARRLKALAKTYGLGEGRVGTVHTAQGKEADVLVLVLGGNPKAPGAKSWAASKPNLVNVAVSRAKKRIYVVGNRAQWAKQKHFSLLAELLPTQG